MIRKKPATGRRLSGRLLIMGLLPMLSACTGLGKSNDALPDVPPTAQIVILGEVHDNPRHHHRQAAYIHALQPSAVVFEMLTPAQADIANSLRNRDASLGESLAWSGSGWPDWQMYQPVFEAVGDARIFGAALAKDLVRRAVSEGAAAVFEGDANRFGLRNPLPAQQQSAREAHQQEAHCNMLPPSLLAGMVEAQRLRDAAFAWTALDALAKTGGPVAVITGTGHARKDWGMPAAIANASAQTAVFSVGQIENTSEDAFDSQAPLFDLMLMSEAVERDDPCEQFKSGSPSP